MRIVSAILLCGSLVPPFGCGSSVGFSRGSLDFPATADKRQTTDPEIRKVQRLRPTARPPFKTAIYLSRDLYRATELCPLSFGSLNYNCNS